MSDLSPECAPKRTSADHSEFMGSRPGLGGSKSWTRTGRRIGYKGAVKQGVVKALGDAKLESDGKADKIEGKVQNAIGGLKDMLKGK